MKISWIAQEKANHIQIDLNRFNLKYQFYEIISIAYEDTKGSSPDRSDPGNTFEVNKPLSQQILILVKQVRLSRTIYILYTYRTS